MLSRALSRCAIHRGAPTARVGILRCRTPKFHSAQTGCAAQLPLIRCHLSTSSAASSPPSSTSTFSASTAGSSSTSTSTTSTPTSSATSRPFRILGLQQVAIGSLSLPSLSSLWRDTFGLPYLSSFTSERENVTEHILTLGPHSHSPFAIELDLMQPLDPATTPAPHQPPLNHIGLWVDDLRAAVQWMEGEGRMRLAPGGIRRGASGYDICFIHPKTDEKRGLKGGEGVLIELVQAPQHVIEAFEAEARRVSGEKKV